MPTSEADQSEGGTAFVLDPDGHKIEAVCHEALGVF